MKKAPEAFRTISEVSEILETPAHVLRFWESKFYQIRPVKRAGGRRYYRPDDLALINGIRILLQVQGLTIRGVQRVLQENGVRHVIELGANLPAIALAGEPDSETLAEQDTGQDTAEALDLDPEIDSQIDSEIPSGAEPQPAREAAPALRRDAQGQPKDGAARHPVDAAAAPASGDALNDSESPDPAALIRQMLRGLDPARLEPQRERVAGLLRRIDRLLDRMSEASGAGRW